MSEVRHPIKGRFIAEIEIVVACGKMSMQLLWVRIKSEFKAVGVIIVQRLQSSLRSATCRAANVMAFVNSIHAIHRLRSFATLTILRMLFFSLSNGFICRSISQIKHKINGINKRISVPFAARFNGR